MDDVACGNQHAYPLARRHDHWLVDFEQVMLALGFLIVDLRIWRLEIADEAKSVIDVVVAPLPLITGDLDGHVRHGRVLHRQNRPGRRKRHEHQDQERNDGPDDFDHGVLVKLGRLMTLRLAMREDRIEHHGKDADEDHDADPHDVDVEVEYLVADRRDRRLQVVFQGPPRRARHQRRGEHCDEQSRLRNESDRLSHPLRHLDAIHAFLRNVDDARKTDALLKSALTRVTRLRVTRQRPAQIARDRGALMRWKFLANRQRFAAMTQYQTRHALACVGFDFEPRPESVELAPRPESATNTLDDNSIAAYAHSLPVVCMAFDPAKRPEKHAHLDHRVRQYRPGAEGREGHCHS